MSHKFLLPHPLEISAIKTENPATKTFTLAGSLSAAPGQFVMVWLPGRDEKPFSLAGTNPIRLTIAAVGPLSRAIHELQVGDLLWVRGPFGRGYHLLTQTIGQVLLAGGGYGVAPLLFLAQQALQRGHRVSMIIGARTAEQLLLADAFQALGVPLWLMTEDGSAGRQGRVTDAAAILLATEKVGALYACGPTGMLAALADLCAAARVPVQLAWEAPMRCGLGLCGSCEVGRGWLTCLDGPVFSFRPDRM
jgi:dihydroorotate dehydrogenase electron transfer subunit